MGKKDKDKDKKKGKDKKKDKKKGKDKDQDKENENKQDENIKNDITKCIEHPTEKLTLFCESCTKCICNICKTNGSHKM